MMSSTQEPSAPLSALRATFMGVSTILFDNGRDSLLIDGFFTRPSLFSCLLSRIGPDEETINRCLTKSGIDNRLHAVLVSHSHYDHALDAPVVCQRTEARLVGSESTRMIGTGYGLPEAQISVVKDGDVLEYGSFRVTVFEGVHSPGDRFPGEIAQPLRVPCAMSSFRTGKCYSWLVEHGNQRIFVHPSANFVPEKFRNVHASTLFMGVAPVGKQPPSFREDYWREVVSAIQPKRLVPIHWDNFWVSLTKPLRPLPWWADSFSVVDHWLRDQCKAASIELYFQSAWETLELGA